MADAPLKIMSEVELLDEDKRKALIAGWDSSANANRKREAFKGYECLKDKTSNYVMELLLRQFDINTVTEMQYALSNISILRKVVSKLAKVYANGVKRTMPAVKEKPTLLKKAKELFSKKKGPKPTSNDEETGMIEDIAEHMQFDRKMAKANKYFKAFKNTLVYVKPQAIEDKFDLILEVLPPFHYDVVPEPNNPEQAMCVVLSDYIPTRKTLYTLGDASTALRGIGNVRETLAATGSITGNTSTPNSGKPDTGADEDLRQFIWWTKNYHFTTNAKGTIIPNKDNPGNENPILKLPFINFAAEQDGKFWADGGDDLIDAGVKINGMITNIKHVAISQGYGQLYMTGKDLPKTIKVGPNHCVQMEHGIEDPVPTIGYLNSNPPIDELAKLVEMDVALMLTTNNLSSASSGVQTSMRASSGGAAYASGIAMIIDKAESIEDVEEQAKTFIDGEPKVWGLVKAWFDIYSNKKELVDAWDELKMPADPTLVQLAFPSPQPVMSENEELDIIQKRYDLGLNTMVELIMRDDPSLDEEEAQEKLTKIEAERAAKQNQMISNALTTKFPQNIEGQVNPPAPKAGQDLGTQSTPNGNGLDSSKSPKE